MSDFYDFCSLMVLIGLVVWVALYFVDAGYGKMVSDKWGPAINNKIGWMLMECPVFLVMLYLWATSDVRFELPYLVMFLFFQIHYFHRSFISPALMRGNSKMPLVIMGLSVVWNLINGYLQGKWLFHLAPEHMPYADSWLLSWQFILGSCIFFLGMAINVSSDYIIRHLRQPGDTKHYLPKGGMYNYVTSANYLGEIIEWIGWAILTWSYAGFVFAWFTASNLVPRSHAIYKKYQQEFAEEFNARKPKLKRIIPFIY